MSILRKLATALMIMFLMIAGTATASAHTETPSKPEAIQSCYGGAVGYNTSGNRLPVSGYYRTTSQCNDINLRHTAGAATGVLARVCFRSTGNCNSYTRISRSGTWHVIASNVLTGTDFYVQIFSTGGGSSKRGQLAF